MSWIPGRPRTRGVVLAALLLGAIGCAAAVGSPWSGSFDETRPEGIDPFLGIWRFAASGTLGPGEPPRGEPNRLRIVRDDREICFTLLAPAGTIRRGDCFRLGESEAGGKRWSVGLAEDGLRVRSFEGNPDAVAVETVLVYRLVGPQGSLLVESWMRAHRLGIPDPAWRGGAYSVYERIGEGPGR